MDSTNLLGGIVALLSAAVWGTGDFAGGLASRRRSQYQVLALASFSGLICLLIAMLLSAERWPSRGSILWSAAAGLSGAIGIAALYRGLAVGEAAVIAPLASVLGAAVPVVVGAVTRGSPGPAKWAGIALGAAGILLVTREGRAVHGTRGLGLALVAGLGFGGFFLLIAQVEPGIVFGPLVVARTVALLFAIVVLAVRRSGRPSFSGSGLALTAGIFDAGGNVLYLLAAHLMRLELAAMIASMAPAMTVVLAWLVAHQKVSANQRLGVGLCLVAVALIIA